MSNEKDSTTVIQHVMQVTDANKDQAGATTWWRLAGDIAKDRLIKAWEEAGLDMKLIGLIPQTAGNALKRALSKVKGERILVRPLKEELSYAVQEETVATADGEEELEYETICRARIIGEDTLHVTGDSVMCEKIKADFEYAQSTFDGYDISMWLAGTLVKQVSAVSLRDKGGFYFVPRTTIDQWRRMVKALRSVSQHKVYELPAMTCAEAVEAVLDAVQMEAEAAAQKMETELVEEDLTARVLRNRIKSLDKIAAKVEMFEGILGPNLDTLRARLEMLNAQITAAIFTAEAAENQEDAA